ncbi:MAG: phage tail tape measure protein, partial [Syntrophorhabdaceae bacterium]
KATGLAGRNFAQEILLNLGKVINWLGLTTIVFAAMRSVKALFTNVIELDHAMTNLRKVTDETSTTYDKFVDSAASSAKRLGVTLVDIVKSTSEFAKLGYSLSQAQTLAETASVYSMVGDMGIDNATESLISSMKAFGVEAKDSILIVDKFNKVGKIYCPAA